MPYKNIEMGLKWVWYHYSASQELVVPIQFIEGVFYRHLSLNSYELSW